MLPRQKKSLKEAVQKLISTKQRQRKNLQVLKEFSVMRGREMRASKEALHLEDDFVQEILREIDAGEVPEPMVFDELTNEQFLFCFRQFLNKKNPLTGVIDFSLKAQQEFERGLIWRFEIEGSGFQGKVGENGHLDQEGVRNIIEYYKIIYPSLSRKGLTIVPLFSTGGWETIGSSLGKSGEVMFVGDPFGGKPNGEFYHATTLYVDYDHKFAYYFDSVNGESRDKTIENLTRILGPEFKIQTHQQRIQADTVSCMFFATSCMVRVAEAGAKFSDSLPKEVSVFRNVPPEFITLSQSLSTIETYQKWFAFISEHKDLELSQLKQKFSEASGLDLDIKTKKGYDEYLRKIRLKYSSDFSSLSDEKFLVTVRDYEFVTMFNSRVELERTIGLFEGFRDEWLPKLQSDHELLARISLEIGQFQSGNRAISEREVNGSVKKQNFTHDQMRMTLLYYMATKRSLKPRPVP